MALTEAERAYLTTQRLGRLATLAPDGTLQNSAVGVHYNDELGTIEVYGRDLGNSRKFTNVEATGEVSFIVDDIASLDPWKVRGIEIRGRAEALRDQTPPSPYFSPEIIRIHPRKIFSWGIEPGATGMVKRII